MANTTSIQISVQDNSTTIGHYWTASVPGFDGSGHDREAAIFDLVGTLQVAVYDLQNRVRELRKDLGEARDG